jgi:hypothetical protein
MVRLSALRETPQLAVLRCMRRVSMTVPLLVLAHSQHSPAAMPQQLVLVQRMQQQAQRI